MYQMITGYGKLFQITTGAARLNKKVQMQTVLQDEGSAFDGLHENDINVKSSVKPSGHVIYKRSTIDVNKKPETENSIYGRIDMKIITESIYGRIDMKIIADSIYGIDMKIIADSIYGRIDMKIIGLTWVGLT